MLGIDNDQIKNILNWMTLVSKHTNMFQGRCFTFTCIIVELTCAYFKILVPYFKIILFNIILIHFFIFNVYET